VKLVFCGTPDFAVPTLQAVLNAGHEVALVLTQPDRPSGRKLELQAPPIKRLALERGLQVLQPEKIKTNTELRTQLEAIQPDAILVVAYGRIIPSWMLHLPRFGNINLHGSLLPKYRGAAPVQWAVANGETETGVTTMVLDEGLDTGGVLLERRVEVGADTMASELFPQLSRIGAELVVETLAGLESGSLKARAQDDSQSTLARILTREDGQIDVERTAVATYNRWRGFYPWPGAFAQFRGKRLIIHRMHPAPPSVKTERILHGEVTVDDGGSMVVGMADETALVLDEVQLEGKPRMAGPEFVKGYQVRSGERLG
jgi:methionyl-tRNA formyltransferase